MLQKKKLLTFSFDDGNVDDVRLVELFNRYGLKGTFNLNSGKLTDAMGTWLYDGKKEVHHLNAIHYLHLYDGHEIAAHTLTHSHLEDLPDDTVYNEIALDQLILSRLYDTTVRGMALPFGTYNDRTEAIAASCGMKYCRTIDATHAFSLPDRVLLHPTCHFKDAAMEKLAEQFLAATPDEPMLFYVWGHSYELVTEDDWQRFEAFCRTVSGHDDVWYCTNIEAIDALNE